MIELMSNFQKLHKYRVRQNKCGAEPNTR